MSHIVMNTELSIDGIDKLIKKLEMIADKHDQLSTNVANRLADDMYDYVMKDNHGTLSGNNPYEGTKKEVISSGNDAVAKISVATDKAYFNEFGTGVKGLDSPSINHEFIEGADAGDTVSYSGKGWWYPTDENDMNVTKKQTETGDWIAYTEGITAKDAYYKAFNHANGNFAKYVSEELDKLLKEK